MTKVDASNNNSEWFEWWVNPLENGSLEADPVDLQQTQQCIETTYTAETQEKIIIKVRPQKQD